MEDLWQNNLLSKPLAIIQVDKKNCFGQLEHLSIDEAITQDHPTMAPSPYGNTPQELKSPKAQQDALNKHEGLSKETSLAHSKHQQP